MISKHYNENSNKKGRGGGRHIEKSVCAVDYKHNMVDVDLKDHKFNM